MLWAGAESRFIKLCRGAHKFSPICLCAAGPHFCVFFSTGLLQVKMENKTGEIDVTPNFLLYSTNFAICCTCAFYSIMQADPML
jgi:hypothetical protein